MNKTHMNRPSTWQDEDGTWRDSHGRFSSPYGQMVLLSELIDTKNKPELQRELEAFERNIDAHNYVDASGTKSIVHPALANKEAEIAERDRLLATGSIEEIQAWMDERINRPEFQALLAERDAVRLRAKILYAQYRNQSDVAKDNLDYDYEIVRVKGFESHDAYDQLKIMKAHAEEYKDVTAPAAARLGELLEERKRAEGTWREFEGETLNGLVPAGDFPSGSREWLEARQEGVGGSDVGKIIGVYKGGPQVEEQLIQGKISRISDEEVALQEAGHLDFAGAAARGNAWEPVLFSEFQDRHPEANVTFCKTSWKDPNAEYVRANVDGLLMNDKGEPDGILELKTGSDASKWGDPAKGIGSKEDSQIPPGYRAQLLWYCDAAKLNHGYIVVKLDDGEVREYKFEMNDELRAEAAANRAKVDVFQAKVDARRANPDAVSPVAPPRKGFGPTIVASARRSFTSKKLTAQHAKSAFSEASIWREESIEQTQARFLEICKDVKDDEEVRRALKQLYTEKDPKSRKRKFVNIDLETSSQSETSGYIIQVGISTRDPKTGKEIKAYDELCGLPRAMERLGAVGEVSVHHITPGMIAKKRQFSHPEVQRQVLEQLKGGVLVAHNALFERKWLRQHLNGFAEAERRGEIQILDTMRLTERLLPEAPSNRLESMCKVFGIPYVGAHRAKVDADLMGDALHGLVQKLHAEHQAA
jgi:DNA polymerase III epsilon subunit-like protein